MTDGTPSMNSSRRKFLADYGLGFTGLALGAMLAGDDVLNASESEGWQPPDGQAHFTPKAKSVVWLFMNGGVSHAESFDPKRAHWHVFVTTVVNRCAANLLRDQRALKRDSDRLDSLHCKVPVPGEAPVELGDCLDTTEKNRHRGQAPRDQLEQESLAVDVTSLLETLNDDDRDLARRLSETSISQAARELGVPRTTLNDAVRRLRQRFEDAALRDWL